MSKYSSKSLVRSNQIILACNSLGLLDEETEAVTIVVRYKDQALKHEWQADNRPSEELLAAVLAFAEADPDRVACIVVEKGEENVESD